MKVKELMERARVTNTGRAVAYIKDALGEIALESPTHIKTVRMDINSGQRFYELPKNAVKILDIRGKGHKNTSDKYQSIPRSIYEPTTEDSDGI